MRAHLLLVPLIAWLGCADPATQGKPTVLMGGDIVPNLEERDATPAPDGDEPVSIRYKPPDQEGNWNYRLILEASGQQYLEADADHRDREPIEQSFMLELEYTELPTKNEATSGQGAYLLRLEALHYRNLQSGAPPQHIELSDDRLRIVTGKDEVETDLEGAQPKEGLTPRMMLRQIFGLVVYDANGDARSVQLRGRPRARKFLAEFPLRAAIRFSRIPRPSGPITPGQAWQAKRFPPNAIGGLGLNLDVTYSLAGYRIVDGVRCAWLHLESKREGDDLPSAAGFTFDRVEASIKGEAFIELKTSRLRRMVVFDESRAAYQRGSAPAPVLEHRLRYKGRMLIELIDPNDDKERWADGKKRFEPV